MTIRSRALFASPFAFIASLSACSPAPEAIPHNNLRETVAAISERGPGCAYVISEGGAVTEKDANGLGDIAAKAPLSPDDIFDIGSISKSFTASIILGLEEKSLLSLNDPLSTYLDGLPPWGGEVTIADLLYMRSGIEDFIADAPDQTGWRNDRLVGTTLTMSDKVTVEQIFDVIKSMDALSFEPGSEYDYSNSNYILLRLVTEQASGETFDILTRNISLELGEIEAKFSTFQNGQRSSPSQIRGYDVAEAGNLAPFFGEWDVAGASGVWLSTHDLAVWGQALMSDEIAFANRSAPGVMDYPDGREGRGYASGLMTVNIDDERVIYHPGGTEGFTSFLYLRPQHDAVLAVTCNMSTDALLSHAVDSPIADDIMEYRELIFLMAWLEDDATLD